MNVQGYQKMSLLDYPGKVACTVFTGGCNLRCPFCHNASLVLRFDESPYMTVDDFFLYIEERNKNRMITEGVCITGGEPLLSHGLRDFILRAKDHGLAVKLDTNGSFPETLQKIISSGSVDYVAMDVKSSFECYEKLCGRPGMTEKVAQSIRILLEGKVDYEFRTTVVDELHTAADIEAAACVIAGAKRYFLQNFTESDDLLSPWSSFSGAGKEKLQEMLKLARIHVPSAELRGVDL